MFHKFKGCSLIIVPGYYSEFSVSRIEYPLGGSSKKGKSCFLLVDICHGTTIVISDCTIMTSDHHGSIRTTFISNNSITQKTCNRKYT